MITISLSTCLMTHSIYNKPNYASRRSSGNVHHCQTGPAMSRVQSCNFSRPTVSSKVASHHPARTQCMAGPTGRLCSAKNEILSGGGGGNVSISAQDVWTSCCCNSHWHRAVKNRLLHATRRGSTGDGGDCPHGQKFAE